MKGQI